MAIEIVDLPINSMVIFHRFLLTFTRGYIHEYPSLIPSLSQQIIHIKSYKKTIVNPLNLHFPMVFWSRLPLPGRLILSLFLSAFACQGHPGAPRGTQGHPGASSMGGTADTIPDIWKQEFWMALLLSFFFLGGGFAISFQKQLLSPSKLRVSLDTNNFFCMVSGYDSQNWPEKRIELQETV